MTQWAYSSKLRSPHFGAASADYGVKSSEGIFLKGASTMEGRRDAPMTFQKKSSLFRVSPVDPSQVCLPIS